MLLVLFWGHAGVATAGKPELDPSYVDGKIYYMIGPHVIVNAITTHPQLYAQSEELYLLVYPLNPTGSTTLGCSIAEMTKCGMAFSRDLLANHAPVQALGSISVL